MNKAPVMVLMLFLFCSVLSASANQAQFDKGIDLLKQGRFVDAVNAFTTVIDLEPLNQNAYRSRGVAYMKQNKYDAAISDLESALKKGADNRGIYLNLGVAWYYKQNYPKAIYYCSKEIEVNPDNAYAYFNRALFWSALKETAKAHKDVILSLGLKSDYYPALCLKADLLIALGQRPEAKKIFEAAYGLAPDQAYAKNRLIDMGVSLHTLQALPRNREKIQGLGASHPTPSSPSQSGIKAVPPKGKAAQNTAAGYALQAGGFKKQINARRMLARLSAHGLTPRMLEMDGPKGNHWYLVRVGKYESRTLARKALQQVRNMLETDVAVRPYGRF